jgi:hypothetical protein
MQGIWTIGIALGYSVPVAVGLAWVGERRRDGRRRVSQRVERWCWAAAVAGAFVVVAIL